MDLPLFVLAAIGLIIFLFSYLAIIVASFRHHSVTGIISLFPGLNLVVLPSTWARTGKAFTISILSLVTAAAAWYAGGHKFAFNYQNRSANVAHTQPITPAQKISSAPEQPLSNDSLSNYNEMPLPQSPLYYLNYEKRSLSDAPGLHNKQIRITLLDERTIEGKVINTRDNALLLRTSHSGIRQTYEVAYSQIAVLEQLVKENE